MAFRIPITSYSLTISRSNPATFTIRGTRNSVGWAARIICYGELDGKRWQGYLFFPEEGEEPIRNFRSEIGPIIVRAFLFFTREEYSWCVDMLRNEKPVFLVWNDGFPNAAYLTTEKEAVGEGELTDGAGATTMTPGATLSDRSYAPFEENSLSHSLVNGYLLAHASRDVYGDGLSNNTGSVFLDWFTERFKPWMTVTPGEEPKFDFISDSSLLGGTGVQAMVMSNDRFVIVTFRGTQWVGDDPLDWASNTAFLAGPGPILGVPVPWSLPGVLMHGGWLIAVEKIYSELLDYINKHQTANQPLWIAGHSLGGALATIAAFKLHSQGDAVVQGVNTYGAPPVGSFRIFSAYAAQDLQRRTRRWVNNRDIGPMINVGYTHVGSKTFIDANGVIDPDSLVPDLMIPSAADHDIVAYCDLIRPTLAPGDAVAVPL